MGRARGVLLGIALTGLAVASLGALEARAAETMPAANLSKTRLLVKFAGVEPLAVKSRFDANPPTIVVEFPSGRVAATLPERSSIQQGVIQGLRTIYASGGEPGQPRWVKALHIELGGRYPYSVRTEAGQVVIEIEHPQDAASGGLEVGFNSGVIVTGELPRGARDRFNAMQAALISAQRPSLAGSLAASALTAPASSARAISYSPLASPRPAASQAPKLMAAKPRTESWTLALAIMLLGAFGTIAWVLYRLRVPQKWLAGIRRRQKTPVGIEVIDQLVWRAFERQGAQLLQVLESDGSAGPLRIFSRDGLKAALQCVSNGTFFEKATVEQFVQAMRAVSIQQGYLVASGAFTVPAQRYAKEQGVLLIGREQLTELLGAGAMQEHYAAQLKDIGGQLDKAREMLNEYGKQLDLIRRQRNEACWLLGEERAKGSKLQAEWDALTKELEQRKAEAEQWKATAEVNQKQWEESQWYLGEARAFAQHVEEQLKPLQETRAQLEGQLADANSAIQERERERDEALAFLADARRGETTAQAQLEELQNRTKELQEGLEAMGRELEEARHSLKAERALRGQFEETLNATQAVVGSDRRRAARKAFDQSTIELQKFDGETVFSGIPTNVSALGFGIDCDHGIKLPKRARLTLSLPGIDKLQVAGRLVWRAEDATARRQWGGYEFVDLPAEISQAIEHLVGEPG